MGFAGNDALISTKGNPYLERIEQLACRYYKSPILETTDLSAFTEKNPTAMQYKFGREKCWQLFAYNTTITDQIKELTIRRSGPACFRDVIQDAGVSTLPGKLHHDITALPDELRSFIDDPTTEHADTPNEASWLAKMTLKELDITEAIDSAVKTAAFEISHMKMLRLDDYIDMLFYSIYPKYPDLRELISHFINKLSAQTELDFSALRYVQYPYRYGYAENNPVLSDFCRKKGIYEKAEMLLFPRIPTNTQMALAKSVTAFAPLGLFTDPGPLTELPENIVEQSPLIFSKNLDLCINGGINFLQHAIEYCKTINPGVEFECKAALNYVNNLSEIVDLYKEHHKKYEKIDMTILENCSIELDQLNQQFVAKKRSIKSLNQKETPTSTLKEKIFDEKNLS